jgi:hypothetical protein
MFHLPAMVQVKGRETRRTTAARPLFRRCYLAVLPLILRCFPAVLLLFSHLPWLKKWNWVKNL